MKIAKSNIFHTLESNEGLSKFVFGNNKMRQIAFLRQKNVFKGITKVDGWVKVTFSYCDQDLQREGIMQFVGTIFQKNLITNHQIEPENFSHRVTIDKDDQRAEA